MVQGRGRMRSFLEQKFGVTPFFKINYFVPVFLNHYEFETVVKTRRTTDGILDLVSY